MEDWTINAAYVVSTLALAVRDVLRLRILLLVAQAMFLWWGLLIEHLPTLIWNALFMAINAVMIGRILWERRPVEIPETLRDIHQRVFRGMPPRDFLLLWELGEHGTASDSRLVAQGETPEALKMVIHGTARVSRDGKHIADIERGGFVAEMSLLAGSTASADVVAAGTVQYLAWTRGKLASLETIKPSVYLALQKAMGRDLTRKARDSVSS